MPTSINIKRLGKKDLIRLWFSTSFYLFCIFVGPAVLSLTKFGWKGWSIAFVIPCQTFSNEIQNWLSFLAPHLSTTASPASAASCGPKPTAMILQYRFRPNHAIIKRVLMEVQSLLERVLVEPPEDVWGRRGMKDINQQLGGVMRRKNYGRTSILRWF